MSSRAAVCGPFAASQSLLFVKRESRLLLSFADNKSPPDRRIWIDVIVFLLLTNNSSV